LNTQNKPVCLPKNSNDTKAKAHYIKYCKILRKVKKFRRNTTVDL